ncbi:MAG: arginine:agmatine antiporter, partial [Chlamydia suis]|nr:arginine:agmatine antiporter [Chlamydia suis]
LQHLFMVAVLLSLGIPFYIDSGMRHGQEKTFLNRQEVLKITTVALIALLAIFLYFAKKNHL